MKPDHLHSNTNQKLSIPRWAAPLVWAAIVLVIQILLPWAVARLAPRIGWFQLAPSWWNLAGLVAVAAGLAMYAWCLSFHFKSYRASVRLSFSPPQLVTGGPYQISRNPMYLSGLLVWFGWTIYYGSPAVLIASILLWLLFALRVVPEEERRLEALFGEEYLTYQRSVGRWV